MAALLILGLGAAAVAVAGGEDEAVDEPLVVKEGECTAKDGDEAKICLDATGYEEGQDSELDLIRAACSALPAEEASKAEACDPERQADLAEIEGE